MRPASRLYVILARESAAGAKDGALYRTSGGLADARPIADFNSLAFTGRAAPAVAMEWPRH